MRSWAIVLGFGLKRQAVKSHVVLCSLLRLPLSIHEYFVVGTRSMVGVGVPKSEGYQHL